MQFRFSVFTPVIPVRERPWKGHSHSWEWERLSAKLGVSQALVQSAECMAWISRIHVQNLMLKNANRFCYSIICVSIDLFAEAIRRMPFNLVTEFVNLRTHVWLHVFPIFPSTIYWLKWACRKCYGDFIEGVESIYTSFDCAVWNVPKRNSDCEHGIHQCELSSKVLYALYLSDILNLCI